jgi:uncharacterized protein YbjT (DUF2867 family)
MAIAGGMDKEGGTMYVITGATGKTGRLIAESLLAEGNKVRAVGRNAEHLRPLVDKGAEPFIGSVSEIAAMTEAFRGAGAVYLMTPPNYMADDPRAYQNDVAKAYVDAIRNEGVAYAVNLSSVGAQLSQGAGPISGLHYVEERLNQLPDLNVVHLRAAYFMENFLSQIDLIKTRNIIGTPLRKDVKIPMIDTGDIADFATKLLLRLDFSGQSTRELLGSGDYSMEEATRTIGKAIGKYDLSYVQFPYEQAEKAMISTGFSQAVAQSLIEMVRALDEGLVQPQEERNAENTTPTTFEKFAACFAAMYRSQERITPAA